MSLATGPAPSTECPFLRSSTPSFLAQAPLPLAQARPGRTSPRPRTTSVRLSLVALLALGCGGAEPASATSPVSAPTTSERAADEPAPTAEATSPAAPAGEIVVIARITSMGPIGSGRCSQRSYELAIETHLAGEALPASVWAHFEHCEGQPFVAPVPPDENLSGLDGGVRYELHLRRGLSASFPDEPMIVSARPAP